MAAEWNFCGGERIRRLGPQAHGFVRMVDPEWLILDFMCAINSRIELRV